MKTLLTVCLFLTILTAQAQKRSGYSDNRKEMTGIGLTVGGVGLTAAAILEGGSQYGTYVTSKPATSTTSAQQTYVTPPFWKQTPRNIMFVVGVGVTVTGLITWAANR